jgi:hypothetical protein
MDLAEQVRDLITQQLAADGGGMVTGFYLAAEFVDGDGDRGWMYASPEGQGLSQTMGIIEFAKGVVRFEQQAYLVELTEDDNDE